MLQVGSNNKEKEKQKKNSTLAYLREKNEKAFAIKNRELDLKERAWDNSEKKLTTTKYVSDYAVATEWNDEAPC